jgi:hypothetical protein
MISLDISPIFLYNIQYKVFSKWCIEVEVVRLKCIKPTKQLIEREEYWGFKDITGGGWRHNYKTFNIYKIFLPVLGCRIYDPKRFEVISKYTLYKKDFTYHEKQK